MTDRASLTPTEAAALARFASEHGRGWKGALRAAWMTASAEPVLHRLRNTHGPSWLARYHLESEPAPDFTAHADPALAVPCPDCGRPSGSWCVRSDGLQAFKLHAARAAAADLAFVEQHGEAATIELAEAGRWVIDPRGRARD